MRANYGLKHTHLIDIIRGAADFDEAVGRICFPQSGPRAAVRS